MNITGTHFNYYLICHRKLWLFVNAIFMENTSDLVAQGTLIHETTYTQRPERFKEIEIDGIKIDYFDATRKVVHEVKKSDSREEAHIGQVKYYLYVLEKNGIEATGLLEYPKLRKTEEVLLDEAGRREIEAALDTINQIITSDDCPERLPASQCRNCSYFDFCWSGEENQ